MIAQAIAHDTSERGSLPPTFCLLPSFEEVKTIVGPNEKRSNDVKDGWPYPVGAPLFAPIAVFRASADLSFPGASIGPSKCSILVGVFIQRGESQHIREPLGTVSASAISATQ